MVEQFEQMKVCSSLSGRFSFLTASVSRRCKNDQNSRVSMKENNKRKLKMIITDITLFRSEEMNAMESTDLEKINLICFRLGL